MRHILLLKERLLLREQVIGEKKAFLAFKHNAPIISYISKINNTLTDNAEDLDIVMPI